jgi:hypothetical protein
LPVQCQMSIGAERVETGRRGTFSRLMGGRVRSESVVARIRRRCFADRRRGPDEPRPGTTIPAPEPHGSAPHGPPPPRCSMTRFRCLLADPPWAPRDQLLGPRRGAAGGIRSCRPPASAGWVTTHGLDADLGGDVDLVAVLVEAIEIGSRARCEGHRPLAAPQAHGAAW